MTLKYTTVDRQGQKNDQKPNPICLYQKITALPPLSSSLADPDVFEPPSSASVVQGTDPVVRGADSDPDPSIIKQK
jgi:hypothetical protein